MLLIMQQMATHKGFNKFAEETDESQIQFNILKYQVAHFDRVNEEVSYYLDDKKI